MIRQAFLLLATTTVLNCSSSKIIQQYKNPDTTSFEANKTLVVGVSSDVQLRTMFEKKVVNALEKENVRAVKSMDFFESSFMNNKQSMEELNHIENKLLDAGFDAILFAKITGRESKVSIVQSYYDLAREFKTFEDYYYRNQYLYFKGDEESYMVYTTETSLYCICPGKDRELLWWGEIEIVDAERVNRNINQYLKILLKELRENQLLITEQ